MKDSLSSFIDAILKTGPVPLMGIGIASLFLLVAPESWQVTIGVSEIVRDFRGWIGITTLTVWGLLAAQAIWWVLGKIQDYAKGRQLQRIREQFLHELTTEEKQVLSPYVFENLNSMTFPIQDGIVGGLVGKSVLYRASNISDEKMQFPFNMNPWARRYLATHPELLA